MCKICNLLQSSRYLQELGASLQTNPKRFWSYVRSCRNTPNNVPAFKVGNQLLSEDEDKAEALNRYFQRVFANEPPMDSLPAPGRVPDAILEFSSEEVRRELKQIDVSKSGGPDEIHARVLKGAAAELALPLTYSMHLFIHVHCLGTGQLQTLPLSIKEERRTFLEIIAL